MTRPGAAAARRYLTPRELCERWGVSPSTLWRGQKAGRYPRPKKIGLRRNGYDLDEVRRCEQGWLPARAHYDAFPLPSSFRRKMAARRVSPAGAVQKEGASAAPSAKQNRSRQKRERLIDKKDL
jgi:predicted DNA-binding transcriptional regulator AlpA